MSVTLNVLIYENYLPPPRKDNEILKTTNTNGIVTFSDLGGSSKQCMRGSDFPYGNYQIKTGITYESNKYVKYEDLKYSINPGIQAAGSYLLSDGSVIQYYTTLTTSQKYMVRAISIGDMNDGISRWIACRVEWSVSKYHWCTSQPVGYITGSGYVTEETTALSRKNGKSLTNIILNSTTNHGYNFTYFPALNYCYLFDFSITGVSQGDGYCMAPGEHKQCLSQSLVWDSWKNITGNSFPDYWDGYWCSLQGSAVFSWDVATNDGKYNGCSLISVDNNCYVLPAVQFS